MRIILVVILAVICGGGATYAWLYFGGFAGEKSQAIAFIDTYGSYMEVVREVEVLVHAPGTEGNNSRAELEKLLTTILTDDLDPPERDALARIAFQHFDVVRKEVDRAQSAQAQMYASLQELDTVSRAFYGVRAQQKAADVVQLARKRAELTARITSVLSETQDQTESLITQILADNGNLTQAHIRDINQKTETAEVRHETLKNLYTELSYGQAAVEAAFNEFVQVTM